MSAIVSCKKHTYEFTYSPSSPKAGEKVYFTNTSDAGENWVWKFGDGGTSTLKSPTHIYKAAGTYVVEMQADSNKQRVTTHVLEVLDSIPSIYLPSETVQQYKPITIKAAFYNPSNAKVTYCWEVDPTLFVFTRGELTSDSITGYFVDYGKTAEVGLTITIGSKTTVTKRSVKLVDNPAPSLVMQSADGMLWRQRIYDGVFEDAKPYDGSASVIDSANDSTAVLNGVTYDIHNMPVLADKEVRALQVDGMNRKLYLILEDGVYVANANGEALERIADAMAQTLLVDNAANCIYWSEADGVKSMPLVTNPQNTISEQLRERIKQVNSVGEVERMLMVE